MKDFEMGRLSWWVLNAVINVFIRKGEIRPRIREKGSGSRHWSNVATSQGMPPATRCWKIKGTDFYLLPLGETP